MKKLTFAMTFVCVSLVSLLLVIGYNFDKNTKEYRRLEENLLEAATMYIDYSNMTYDNKITSAELINAGYLDNLITKDGKDQCDGYVVLEKGLKKNYKAYITCKKYRTEE